MNLTKFRFPVLGVGVLVLGGTSYQSITNMSFTGNMVLTVRELWQATHAATAVGQPPGKGKCIRRPVASLMGDACGWFCARLTIYRLWGAFAGVLCACWSFLLFACHLTLALCMTG